MFRLLYPKAKKRRRSVILQHMHPLSLQSIRPFSLISVHVVDSLSSERWNSIRSLWQVFTRETGLRGRAWSCDHPPHDLSRPLQARSRPGLTETLQLTPEAASYSMGRVMSILYRAGAKRRAEEYETFQRNRWEAFFKRRRCNKWSWYTEEMAESFRL